MKDNKKKILILLVLFLGIGFAYLSTTLTIKGSGIVKKGSWNIYFDNVVFLEGAKLSKSPPTTYGSDTTNLDFSVNLNNPGDVYEFYVDIVNDSSVDAIVDLTSSSQLTQAQQKYVSYSITYYDGSAISKNNVIKRKSLQTIKVRVEYNTGLSASDLASVMDNISFGLTIDYINVSKNTSFTERTYPIEYYKDNRGYDVAQIGAERFYVLSPSGCGTPTILMAAKPLNLGINILNLYEGTYETIENPTGKQDIYLKQLNDLIPFSTTNYWVENGSLKSKYGTSYPARVFDENSNLYSYVKDYEDYINSISNTYHVTARLPIISDLQYIGCDFPATNSCDTPYWLYSTSRIWIDAAMSNDIILYLASSYLKYSDVYDADKYNNPISGNSVRVILEINDSPC